jgi:DNA-binding response OmpR family regulator
MSSHSPQGAGYRYVLVVENEPSLRDYYRAVLQQAGFAAVAVDDGLSALRWIEHENAQALMLDLVLPRPGGYDMEQLLSGQQDTQQTLIVVVTGSDTSGLNLDDFACILRNPASADELIAAVARCVRRKASSG